MHEKVGIIAGTGQIPKALIQQCVNQEIPFISIAIYGHTDPKVVQNTPHCWFPLGKVGQILSYLKAEHVKTIVFAGAGLVQRPSFKDLSLDAVGLKLLLKIGTRWSGDNTALVTISKFLEDQGFCICAPQDFLPSLVSEKGYLGHFRANDAALKDAEIGKKLLETVSVFDFGQGVAVQNGFILGIEAAEGTDACILRCGLLKRDDGPKPIYIKRAKINQDEKCDLPVVGPKTLEALASAGFAGLCFQAGKTLILEPQTLSVKADQREIFLLGLE